VTHLKANNSARRLQRRGDGDPVVLIFSVPVVLNFSVLVVLENSEEGYVSKCEDLYHLLSLLYI